MDFQFVLPRANADLLNSDGNNYFVKQVYNAGEIGGHIKEAYQTFQQTDAFYIFDHFDTFFSVIQNASQIQMSTLVRAADILYSTTTKFGLILDSYLKKKEFNRQSSFLNLTKMILYLVTSTVRAIDAVVKNESNDGTAQKRSKQKQNDRPTIFADWNEKRYQILVQIFNVMQMPLEKLWNESIAEEEFVNMICELGYRTLDQPNVKEKRVNDIVFQIFGLAIKQYNHALAFPVRIIQILSTQEIAVVPIARGVRLLSEEYQITSVFGVLLKELVDVLSVSNSDTLITKHVSMFLTEVAEVSPKLIIPHLSQMSQELLNLEPYVVRNCVLGIMGQVITRELTGENMDEEQRETRDEFLEDLLNHLNDVSGYVRSKTLQIWNDLKTEQSVPLSWQLKVVRTAVERLEDKAALVRKNAVILLKSFLETNPFAAKLSIQELEAKFQEEENNLQRIRDKMVEQERTKEAVDKKFEEEVAPLLHPIIAEYLENEDLNIGDNDVGDTTDTAVDRVRKYLEDGAYDRAVKLVVQFDVVNREIRKAMPFAQQCLYYVILLQSYLINNYDEEFDTQNRLVEFYSDSIEFSKCITEAVPKIEVYLMSKTNTDVFEAVDFFTTGYLFHIKGTESGMRRMLSLIWTGDKEKRAAVTKAYNRILFQTDAEGRPHALKVVDNLCDFFEKITCGEYNAMEAMMKEWIEDSTIDAHIIQVFFERFTQKLPNTSDNMARICLQLLIMVSNAKPSIVGANKDLLIATATGERGLKDPRVYASCLELLMNLAPPASTTFYLRFDRNDETVQKVTKMFKSIFFEEKLTKSYEGIATKTISFLYHLCQSPDLICQELLVSLCEELKKTSIKKLSSIENEDPEGQAFNRAFDRLHLPKFLVARLIFVFGYIAMKEMIFLDIDVYNNMKYREDLKKEKNDLKKKINKRKSHLNNLNSSASDALKRLSCSANEPQQEPDEMLIGATAEDSIAELINQICESELICSTAGLLHHFVPILTEILGHPGKYADEHIQAATSLTLLRFMSVSSKFCNEHMPFLMNVMQKTKSVQIKCNIIIGLSDFTCRFPNVIEPWTSHLYATLLEDDVEVRLTAVKMLSHLILQEMIRVRGQISDMAVCIVDEHESIRTVTKAFFKEIANKSNILYNVLPDIISRLSSVDTQLEEAKYHIIMKYIMGLIQKDRQVETLVEKLCLRFKVTSSDRQWRDIAFCLSLLTYTEKTIKKLGDHIPNYRDKIQIDEVYDCFKTIISNTNKLAKPEMKQVTKDFELKLQECLNVTENGAAPNAQQASDSPTESERRDEGSPVPARGRRGTKVDPKKKRAPQRRSSSSEESDFDFNEPAPPRGGARKGQPVPARATQRGRQIQRNVIDTESDEDSDEPPPRPQNKKTRN